MSKKSSAGSGKNRRSPKKSSTKVTVQQVKDAKQQLRKAIVARRAVITADEAAASNSSRNDTVRVLLHNTLSTDMTLALYLSTPTEPDTLELVAYYHALGISILLPRFDHFPEPTWARYTGANDLEISDRGILQPTTQGEGSSILERADTIILPGLAATPSGVRLGMGAGWYDRALLFSGKNSPRILLLNDNEVLPTLPSVKTDQLVDVIITEKNVYLREENKTNQT